jgi:hypothetical protein
MYFTQQPEYRPYIDALRKILDGVEVSSLEEIRKTCHVNLRAAHPAFRFNEMNGTAEYATMLMHAGIAELRILQGWEPREAYLICESRDLSRSLLTKAVELSDMVK